MGFQMGVLLAVLTFPLLVMADPVGADSCDDSSTFCVDTCSFSSQQNINPSDEFMTLLKRVGEIGYDVSTSSGRDGVTSLQRMRFSSYSAVWKDRKHKWLLDGKFRGPCYRLRAVFRSKIIKQQNKKNGADIWELVYADAKTAKHVGDRIVRHWDWQKHPIRAVVHGYVVFIVEGRHRDPRAVKIISDHLVRNILKKAEGPSGLKESTRTERGK